MDGRVAEFDNDNKVFNKCGEILFTTDVGERIYSFSCIFCNELYTKFDDFVTHLEIQHSDDFLLKIKENEGMREEEDKDDEFIELPQSDNEILYGADVLDVHDSEDELPLKDTNEEILEVINVDHKPAYIDNEVYDEDSADGDYDDNDDDDINADLNGTAGAAEDTFEYEDNSGSELEEDEDDLASADQKVLKLAIILAYEKHPILWRSSISSRKIRKSREEAFAKIAKSVNKQLAPLQLTVNDVRVMIKQVSLNYRNEMQKQKLAKLNGGKINPPWYFDKLKFLDCHKGSSKKNEVEKPTRKHIGLPLPYFTDEQHLELFDIYKEFPSLWNVHDVGFHAKKMRDKALEEMAQIVNEKMELDYSPDKLRRKLYQIRYACSQDKYHKLECERIQKPFKATTKYYEQIAFLEPHVQPFKCPYCEEVFGFPHKFVLHKAEHDGSLPYKCTICNHGFKLAANCVVHMRRHTQEFPYSCKECGKGFASSTEVTLHMRHHKGERLFVCEICGRSFFTPTTLEYHKRRHVNNRSFKCSVCGKAFYDNYQLKQHMQCHLNVRDQVCNICGKAFNLAKHLRQHKQIHADVKKYSCKICGKEFAQSAGLSGHMKTHGNTKNTPLKLDLCMDVEAIQNSP